MRGLSRGMARLLGTNMADVGWQKRGQIIGYVACCGCGNSLYVRN